MKRLKINYLLLCLVCIAHFCGAQSLDLSGEWKFKSDPQDKGIAEKWFNSKLKEPIHLPGSMTTNNKGNKVDLNTPWVGEILDSSFFKSPEYERYRQPDNFKIPFWLQPIKYYSGAAWYQKEVTISKAWAEKSIELFLERPHWETQVWINSQPIGMRNSLGTPHRYLLTNQLKPGKHLITIRVDNSIKDIVVGGSAHSITDQTQTNWNGIVGKISLNAKPKVIINDVKIYPNIEAKNVRIITSIQNFSEAKQTADITFSATRKDAKTSNILTVSERITVEKTGGKFEFELPMGDNPALWDEFHPNLYVLTATLKSNEETDQKETVFGMREIGIQGKQFTINQQPIFLRGTLECAIFPLTGYPFTQKSEWARIFKIVKNHGLNHVRFHSWCPPEAAFDAADELGVYLQVEASSWANDKNSTIGDGLPLDKWLYQETTDILNAYGNHPSFCLMAYGNEPGGKNQTEYLNKYVTYFKDLDNRRMYTGGAGWPFVEKADFYNNANARIQLWGAGLKSIINSKPPQTVFDFQTLIDKTPMPYVSHEIGQWCVYPNFKEISKYTGVLKPKNFEIFQETLTENGMGALADSFLLASGKLQALCYKADIEASLRTKDMAGFQLLDLHDFPGQGTALVGVLDAFWDEKGYISPQEYRQFCNQTVPLVRLPKRVFINTEMLNASVEITHFGEKPLPNIRAVWEVKNAKNEVLFNGNFKTIDIPIGSGTSLGKIALPLNTIQTAQKLVVSVTAATFTNTWDIWVYPVQKAIPENSQLKVVSKLDASTLFFLENGGNVLLSIPKGNLRAEKGGNVGIGFSSIFWNTAYTSGQLPSTLGILCNPKHPALQEFPTEYHSNWQWWDAMSNSNAIILNDFPSDLTPIVRIVDDWFKNRKTALIFEAKVGKGSLLVSGIDLHTNIENRLEAQQLLYSLKKYMVSDKFNPKTKIEISEINSLFTK